MKKGGGGELWKGWREELWDGRVHEKGKGGEGGIVWNGQSHKEGKGKNREQ